MKLTEKLDKMMHDKGINKNTLSKESGIPYSTIRSLYVNGSENIKLSTLKALCEYFDCSADYLVFDDLSECSKRIRPRDYYLTTGNTIADSTPALKHKDAQTLLEEIANNILNMVFEEAERRWDEEKETEKVRYIVTKTAGEAK